MRLDETTSPARIRTVIADDEPLARDLLTALVRRDAGLELVATAASGSETLAAVRDYSPQLLLLDVQMPSLDGISVAEQLAGQPDAPYVIFVTAHDEFALQAFEVAVRDYLVKPVSKRRFAAAILRAKRHINEHAPVASAPLIVKKGENLVSLTPSDIVWVSAANQYVQLHTLDGQDFMLSQSLRQFAKSLVDDDFVRIHRSTMVNKKHIVAVLSGDGAHRVQVRDGTEHAVARNRRSLLPMLLQCAREKPNQEEWHRDESQGDNG